MNKEQAIDVFDDTPYIAQELRRLRKEYIEDGDLAYYLEEAAQNL